MAVKLESSIKRFIGLSTDDKPRPGVMVDGVIMDAMPAGSSFLESDTGRIYRWDGASWTHPLNEGDDVFVEILNELRMIRVLAEFATQ